MSYPVASIFAVTVLVIGTMEVLTAVSNLCLIEVGLFRSRELKTQVFFQA